jgi:diketogulonate reductase-like aldo/keto reductase
MAEACEEGKVRSLGVSNYSIGHLDELWEWIGGGEKRGCLSVGQWEVTPWCARREWREWCRHRGVVVQAYSPLVKGTRFGEPVLKALAEKYGKTPAQILVRWSLQNVCTPFCLCMRLGELLI